MHHRGTERDRCCGEPPPSNALETSGPVPQTIPLEGQPTFFQTNLVIQATTNSWYGADL